MRCGAVCGDLCGVMDCSEDWGVTVLLVMWFMVLGDVGKGMECEADVMCGD